MEIKELFTSLKNKIYLKMLKIRGMKYGYNFHIEKGVYIDGAFPHLIEIGNNVTMTPFVKILAHDASTKMYLGYTKIGKVKIGNNVFIGANSIILPGVQIGDDVIIGAGSVVTKDIPQNSVEAGIPAKFICSTDNYIKSQSERIKHSFIFDESYKLKKLTKEKRKKMQILIDKKNGFIK